MCRAAFRSFGLCILALNAVLAPVAALKFAHAGANASRRYSPCDYDAKLAAECLESIYSLVPDCGCWVKWDAFYVPELVAAQLYRNGEGCLLAFSGQLDGDKKWERNSLGYLMDHDFLVSQALCGRDTVSGFVTSTKRFFGDSNWTRLADILAGPMCSQGIGVVGTSLGGAFAEILAGCANQDRLSELQARGAPAFRIDRLTTFGAPPTTKTPIANALAQDGCFPGQRVFRASNTSETGSTDLVAYSTGYNGYLHARQMALQLVELPGGGVDVQAHPCRAEATAAAPDWNAIQPYLSKLWNEEGVGFLDATVRQVSQNHQMASYNALLDKVSAGALHQAVQEASRV